MKRTDCNVIVDLLPLYEDGCCSEESRRLVEEHISVCEQCRKLMDGSWTSMHPEKMEQIEPLPDEKKLMQGFKKIKRARILGIRLLVICIAAIFIGILSCHQIMGQGICFSSIGKIHHVMRFVRLVEQGNYEMAYDMLDVERSYEELLVSHSPEIEENVRDIESKGFEWYDNVCRAEFISNMAELEQQGKQIESHQFCYAWELDDNWEIGVRILLESGNTAELRFYADNDKIDPQISADNVKAVDNDVEKSFTRITFNETIAEALYKNTGYDWRVLFKN